MVSLPPGAVGKVPVTAEPSIDVTIQSDGSFVVARAEWNMRAIINGGSELHELTQKIGVARIADALAEAGHLDEAER
jgi:hypothetical protein